MSEAIFENFLADRRAKPDARAVVKCVDARRQQDILLVIADDVRGNRATTQPPSRAVRAED